MHERRVSSALSITHCSATDHSSLDTPLRDVNKTGAVCQAFPEYTETAPNIAIFYGDALARGSGGRTT
jgi:hypothetical protein